MLGAGHMKNMKNAEHELKDAQSLIFTASLSIIRKVLQV